MWTISKSRISPRPAQTMPSGFAVPPGKRLGRHTDTAGEMQMFLSGSGELLLDHGPQPVKGGDGIVGTERTMQRPAEHRRRGSRVIGFFASPQVEQHRTDEVRPGDLTATNSRTSS
jgi:hypothetical protein